MSPGVREARLRRLLAVLGRPGAMIVSAALMLQAIRRLRGGTSKRTVPQSLFIGIEAMRERELVPQFASDTQTEPFFIDQRNGDGFSCIETPSTKALWRSWLCVVHEARLLMKRSDLPFGRQDILASLAMRVHPLSCHIAFFETLRKTQPTLKLGFSTTDLPAHAACIVGFDATYYQHGFIKHSLVYPEFAQIIALNTFEAKHMGQRVPNAEVLVRADAMLEPNSTKVIALAGDYSASDRSPVDSLIAAALAQHYHVVIRPHPQGIAKFAAGVVPACNLTKQLPRTRL